MIGRRALAATLTLALSTPALADPHRVLVLRAEGAADEATRTRIDTVVLRLAKHTPGQITLGDISFSDAETAVGCTGDAATCKDDVLSTMAADELIATTVEENGPDLQVTVRRASKGEAVRSAAVALAAGDTSETALERGLAPLFNVSVSPSAEPKPTAPPTPPPIAPTTPPIAPTTPMSTNTPDATVTAAPAGVVDTTPTPDHGRRHQLELIGMASGGVLAVLGLLEWNAASNTQNQINAAPTKTAAELMALQSLESTGDGQAALGNVLFVGGLVLAGVSTFFWWRDRHSHRAPAAQLAPVALDHGAGITLTFGGSR